jgi:hypothetical protein
MLWGKLRTSQGKKEKRLPIALRDFIKTQFEVDPVPFSRIADTTVREYANDQFLRLQMLDVPDGRCQVEPHNQSRFNMANVDVAMTFFKELVILVKHGHLTIAQIKILTFYNAQKRRLINALVDLGEELKLTANELVDVVHTSDSFQGQEADIIILDTTVCSYNGHGTLGHVGDERKFNVALTRAKECLFVIGNLKILDSHIIAEQERVECVVDLLQTVQRQRSYKKFTSTAKPENIVGAKFDYQVKKEEEAVDVEGETAVEDVGNAITGMHFGSNDAGPAFPRKG